MGGKKKDGICQIRRRDGLYANTINRSVYVCMRDKFSFANATCVAENTRIDKSGVAGEQLRRRSFAGRQDGKMALGSKLACSLL